MSELDVLKTIIAEAGGDPANMLPVAAVILNRSKDRGKTLSQIVKQKGQFEGYSNPGPKVAKSLNDPKLLARAREVLAGLQNGSIADPTENGTYYHATSINPYWAKSANKNGSVTIGGNKFYKGNAPTAVAAIDAAVPMPRSRPSTVASAYADTLRSIIPQMQLPQQAMYGVNRLNPGQTTRAPTDFTQDPSGQAIPPQVQALLAQRSASPVAQGQAMARPSIVPQPGIVSRGTQFAGAAAPTGLTSRSVNTVPIDPMTGNPVQSQQPNLQAALAAYAARQAMQQQGGIMRTQGQAGNVGLPPGVVPQSVQQQPQPSTNPTASALMQAGLTTAGSLLPRQQAPNVPPAVPRPMLPGPNGTLIANKDPSQLGGAAIQPLAFGAQPPVAPPVAAINAATVPMPRPRPTPTTKGVPNAWTEYTVKSGDTLGQIASQHGRTISEVASANGINNPNQIAKGQKLVIPTDYFRNSMIPQPMNRPAALTQPSAFAGAQAGGGLRSIIPQVSQGGASGIFNQFLNTVSSAKDQVGNAIGGAYNGMMTNVGNTANRMMPGLQQAIVSGAIGTVPGRTALIDPIVARAMSSNPGAGTNIYTNPTKYGATSADRQAAAAQRAAFAAQWGG